MSVLLVLRDRTREAHDRLEDGLDVLRRCADRPSYAALLQAMRSVHAPLERALDACPATAVALPDWAERRGKTAWLDADLAALGVPVVADAPVPPVTTAAQVVGAAYVLEGATLGGGVIVRGLPADWPQRFFTSYGARRGRLWRDFRAGVDALPGLDADAAVDTARRTFAAFEATCLQGAA